MFWFKRKPIVVDAFTYKERIATDYAIAKSTQYLPEWWRQLPASRPHPDWSEVATATMKTCQGFIDLYRNSFTLPLWSDLCIELDNSQGGRDWRYIFADRNSLITEHNRGQFDGTKNFPDQQHFKIESPWILKEKTGVQFLMTEQTWNQEEFFNAFKVLPGVLDFRYQHSVNINTFFRYTGAKESILLPAGHALAFIIPLTEHDVEFRCHVVTQQEYNTMCHVPVFKGLHKHTKEVRTQGRCPF